MLSADSNVRQINEPIDLAKHVIARDVPFEAEHVEQCLLHHCPLAHHRESPRLIEKTESEPSHRSKRVFQHNPPNAEIQTGALPDCDASLGRIFRSKGRALRVKGWLARAALFHSWRLLAGHWAARRPAPGAAGTSPRSGDSARPEPVQGRATGR